MAKGNDASLAVDDKLKFDETIEMASDFSKENQNQNQAKVLEDSD